MEKLKDFLYDKNDILIAFLVLVFAALLIIWRMNVIMDYPEKMFAEEGMSDSSVVGGEEDDSEGDDSQSGSPTQPDQDDESAADADQGGGSDDAAPSSLWADGRLTREVEVDVYGNSAMAAVNCLVDAGLFTDYAEYQRICEDTGLNHEKVSAGTLTFAAGTTKQEIARKVNWS